MPSAKSSFLDKVLGRIGRLDREGLQTVVQKAEADIQKELRTVRQICRALVGLQLSSHFCFTSRTGNLKMASAGDSFPRKKVVAGAQLLCCQGSAAF